MNCVHLVTAIIMQILLTIEYHNITTTLQTKSTRQIVPFASEPPTKTTRQCSPYRCIRSHHQPLRTAGLSTTLYNAIFPILGNALFCCCYCCCCCSRPTAMETQWLTPLNSRDITTKPKLLVPKRARRSSTQCLDQLDHFFETTVGICALRAC